jgi:hypothetical protein
MKKIIGKLRLNTFKGNSNNIWLGLLFIFLLLGINFQSLLIPTWMLIFLAFLISVIAIISFLSYGYLILYFWGELDSDEGFTKIGSFCGLSILVFFILYLSFAVVFGIG